MPKHPLQGCRSVHSVQRVLVSYITCEWKQLVVIPASYDLGVLSKTTFPLLCSCPHHSWKQLLITKKLNTCEKTATGPRRRAPPPRSSAAPQSTAPRCLRPRASRTESLKWSAAQWSPAHTCLPWRQRHVALLSSPPTKWEWEQQLDVRIIKIVICSAVFCSLSVCSRKVSKFGPEATSNIWLAFWQGGMNSKHCKLS